MKTLIVSLAALAAVSGASLASERGELRDSENYFGKYSTQHKMEGVATDSNAFAVVKAGKKKPTAFERMNLNTLQGEGHGEAGQSHGPAKS